MQRRRWGRGDVGCLGTRQRAGRDIRGYTSCQYETMSRNDLGVGRRESEWELESASVKESNSRQAVTHGS